MTRLWGVSRMSMFNISVSAHNNAICKNAEDAINSMIDLVKEHGGKVWIQSKDNKEHYYEFTGHISLNYYVPIPDYAVRVDYVPICDDCEEDE